MPNSKDEARAAKTANESGVIPADLDPNRYYNVALARPARFRSSLLRPEQNPHLMTGDAIRIMSEGEPADAFESVEDAGDGKELARRGADPDALRANRQEDK